MLRNKVVTLKVFPNFLATAGTYFNIFSSNTAYYRICLIQNIKPFNFFFHIGFAFSMKLSNTGCSCLLYYCSALPFPSILGQNLPVVRTIRKEMHLMLIAV